MMQDTKHKCADLFAARFSSVCFVRVVRSDITLQTCECYSFLNTHTETRHEQNHTPSILLHDILAIITTTVIRWIR